MSTRALEFALMVTFLTVGGMVLLLIAGPHILGSLVSLVGVRLAAKLAVKPAVRLIGRLPQVGLRRVPRLIGERWR
jgi:hypothetical protein